MTLGELRALVRVTLASVAAWPDDTLDRWIGAAVRLYSAHCPRQVTNAETGAVSWELHALPDVGDDDAALTVPEQHIEALTAYTEFAAHYELESDEACVADGSTIVLAQLGEESRRAWNRYKEVMDRLVWLGPVGVGASQPVWAAYGL